MSVPSLARQAGLKIPINSLFFAAEHEGNVINQEFLDYVRRPPRFGTVDFRTMCTVCNMDGDCLCYLFQIRHVMLDCYWGEEDDYRQLSDWLTLADLHEN